MDVNAVRLTFDKEFVQPYILEDYIPHVVSIELIRVNEWWEIDELALERNKFENVIPVWRFTEVFGKPYQEDYIHLAPTVIPKPKRKKPFKSGNSVECYYSVGNRYNGGIVRNENHYQGYIVPPPIIPMGWKMKSLHCSPQYSAYPPCQTALLVKE